jgi:hypothetical protein
VILLLRRVGSRVVCMSPLANPSIPNGRNEDAADTIGPRRKLRPDPQESERLGSERSREKTMKSLTETTETETAYTEKLPKPIPFDFGWTVYENVAEMQAAGDGLSLEAQLRARNAARKAKARQAALTAALTAAGFEKPNAENNDQVRLRDMFKTLMSSKKYTEDAARAKAAEVLELEWED